MTARDVRELARARGVDVDDPMLPLKVAAERLSIVRYVFLVQIEDGIASASQRASLEYADAVLIGWPEADASGVVCIDGDQVEAVRAQMRSMEQYVAAFVRMERDGDVEGMADTLIRVTERVAEIRCVYQPGFLLPTFAEIRRVVQEEWDEDMGRIDPQGEGSLGEADLADEGMRQAGGNDAVGGGVDDGNGAGDGGSNGAEGNGLTGTGGADGIDKDDVRNGIVSMEDGR